MFERIEISIRRLRKYLSRSRLLIKLLGLSKSDATSFDKGLIIIQIDALSKKQLEKALSTGKMPFIKKLLNKEHYNLHSHYAGMPCSTASVQAELFYGIKSAVPAFKFYDHKSERVFTMFNPRDAQEIESRLREQGKPLLSEGSSYSNIYTGGAKESNYCISSLGIGDIFKKKRILTFFLLAILHFYSFIRTLCLLIIESCLALIDCLKGMIKGKGLWKEFKFVPSRVGICVLLRELIVIGTKIDISRNLPIIHLNLMGFHEQSHRRGPSSRFAHWTLKGIDDSVKRIWTAAKRSTVVDYDIWIYSDHGQIDTIPFEKKFGKSVHKAVTECFNDLAFSSKNETKSPGFLTRSGLRKPDYCTKEFCKNSEQDFIKPIITALGPMGHIYLPQKLGPKDTENLAVNLIKKAHIPTVFFTKKQKENKNIEIWSNEGYFNLPEQADKIFDKTLPFFNEMTNDFIEACKADNSGDVLIYGHDMKNNYYYTFTMENGSHGGMTSEETEGFALLPIHYFSFIEKEYVRPMDLRKRALKLTEGLHPKDTKSPDQSAKPKNTLRIMTYNVHSCIGMDGKLSPKRIAEVISQYRPDIVALQELDVGRERTGKVDQAITIAEYLNMDHHFHATIQVAEESFGDAVLSSYPMRLIKKDQLSKNRKFLFLEPRGGIWIQLDFNSKKIQIINTHLGLHSKERYLHAQELLGEKWLANQDYKDAVILCGDFNILPGSRTFKLINSHFSSVQTKEKIIKHKATWFGRYPVACLDHVFVSSNIEVLNVEVCDSYLARLGSDHRPIVADLKIGS